MTPAWARSLLLAGSVGLVACSSSGSTSEPDATQILIASTTIDPAPSTTSVAADASTTSMTITPTSTPTGVSTTAVAVDPSLFTLVDLGAAALPAPGDELAVQYHGFTGDPLATLQGWLITPMAVPSGADVRLLGFERTIGINTTTATYLIGAVDPEAALAAIAAVLAPAETYTLTPSTRTEGTVTIHSLDAQPNTVQGDPPGWSVEASVVDQLGIVRFKRSDYSFDDVVATFQDLPSQLQDEVVHQDAIAVNAGGFMSSASYEYGVAGLGEPVAQRTRLTYEFTDDLATATENLARLLSVGWDKSEETDAVYFTSTTSEEVWTLDDFGGTTHLTYDTGS
jgi:hypothetical protein